MWEQQLREELRLAASAVETEGDDYLSSLPTGTACRFTWVAPDGTVLRDTQADAASMENHAQREEIRQALTTGSGSSVRYSDTLTEKTVYEAVRLSDGSVLRIAGGQKTVGMLVLGLLHAVIAVALLAAGLSALLASRAAKRVVAPLNQLDLEHPMENDAYDELSPLLSRIHAQQQALHRQARDLERRQDEFEQITDSMREGLLLLGQDHRILSINPAAQTLFGTDRSCIGRDFLTVDRRSDISAAVDAALTQGHAQLRQQRQGREYQIDLSRIDSGGEVFGAVLLAFDVTEQAEAERMRREFTANVSHELKTPLQSIIGSVELLGGEIAEDIASYFVESEQIPTACGLGVLVDRDRSVLRAGGYLIQLLPGAPEGIIDRLEKGIMEAGPVTKLLLDNDDPESLLRRVMSGFELDILETAPVEYRCYCSRERMAAALVSLGGAQLSELAEDENGIELTCQFCDSRQRFTQEDIRRLLETARKKN